MRLLRLGAISQVQTRVLRGSIGSSEITDLLLSLRASAETGRLRLEREGVARDLYLKAGAVIAADSSAETDSLEWLLFTAGVISEDRHGKVRSRIEGGERRGRALVESGSLSPVSLCEWTRRRVRFLASDALNWRSGSYAFENGVLPPPGSISVDLDPVDILLQAMREESRPATVTAGMPAPDLRLDAVAAAAGAGRLLAHEAYVLSLVDGVRRVSEICCLSEIGEAETLRTLSLLSLAGCVRESGAANPQAAVSRLADPAAQMRPAAPGPDSPLQVDLPEGESPADLRAIIRAYNDHFVLMYGHMIKEVGPIAEQLLDKHLRDVREAHAAILGRVLSGRDGSLPEDALTRNVNQIKNQNRREALVSALNGYMLALVSSVRRILGPAHEEIVMRRLRELRCTRT
jgi:hypothetical protein